METERTQGVEPEGKRVGSLLHVFMIVTINIHTFITIIRVQIKTMRSLTTVL